MTRGYYALAEQIVGDFGPDVLTLQRPVIGSLSAELQPTDGGIAVADAPPKVRFHARAEIDIHARKAKAKVKATAAATGVIAMIELVSPGNKNGQTELAAFVEKADEVLRGGIHLLIVDLFPPTVRDPQGIHRAIWGEGRDGDFALPEDKPLTCVAQVWASPNGGGVPRSP